MASLKTSLVALFSLCCALLAPPAKSEEVYQFGVVPQYEQRKLYAIWRPIIDELSRRTGLKFNLVATLTVTDFERELSRGSYDLVYANPYHILREASGQGYIPLVRDKQPLRGIIVVRKDSLLKAPHELHEKELAIPSWNALGASLLIRADLEQVFKAVPKATNVKTHSSVYMNVALGLTPAGGGVEKTLQEQPQTIRDQLRILYTTREMPSHPIAAHPRIPAVVRDKIQKTLLEMASTDAGKQLFADIPIESMISTGMKDYQPMKQWGLDSYWVN